MSKAKKHPRSADTNDRALGERVRTLRIAKKMSQSDLGAKLGVSFQQIQKYEKGTNRIAAARLQEIAAVLEEPISALLGAEVQKPSADYTTLMHSMADREVQRLVKAFIELPAAQRQKLTTLVEAMAA